MGAPELPGDPGGEDLRPTQNLQIAPLPSSDDSENEGVDIYNGYQQLSLDENGDILMNGGLDDNDDDDDDYDTASEQTETQENESDSPVSLNTNLPAIESVDVEIERNVWNAPRPQELQIELDNARTEQILNVMANLTLPNVTIPDWALGVPEERWKEDLLQRIRQRKAEDISQIDNKIDNKLV